MIFYNKSDALIVFNIILQFLCFMFGIWIAVLSYYL